eukprot:11902910-Alexandrium_andersonii.AAC.1
MLGNRRKSATPLQMQLWTPRAPRKAWAAPEGLQRKVYSGCSRLQQVPALPSCFERFPALPLQGGYRPPRTPPKSASGAMRFSG